MRQLSAFLATFFLGGCAAAINGDRAKFSGPVVKPLWVVPRLEIDRAPIIHESIVYVEGRESNQTHLYAFDLKTGKLLWTSSFATDGINAVVGTRLAVTDDKGLLHSVDSKTGKAIDEPRPSTILSATTDGNTVYLIFKDRTVVALDGPGHALWKATVPMSVLFPPVAMSGIVYIYGQMTDAKGLKDGCAIHAFEAASGVLRWKWQTQECSGTEDIPFSAISADSNAVYIRIDSSTSADGKAGAVIALDAATGKQKWTAPTVQFQPGAPMLVNDSVLAFFDNITGDHGGTANSRNPYLLRGLDRSTGQMKWENRAATKYGSGWTARDGLLFIADRTAHALIGTGNATSPDSFLTVVDIRTARELWRSGTVTLGSFTTPAVSEGIVVVGSLPFGDGNPNAGGLYAFAATREPGKGSK